MGKKSFIAKAPIRRLMKAQGADLVAESAVELLIVTLEEIGEKITKEAQKLVNVQGRKKLTDRDMHKAQKIYRYLN